MLRLFSRYINFKHIHDIRYIISILEYTLKFYELKLSCKQQNKTSI